jgi:hypothetical protein
LTVEARLAAELRQRFPEAKIHSVTIDRDQEEARRTPSDRRSAELNEIGEAAFSGLRPGLWHTYVLVEAAGTVQPLPLEDVELTPGQEGRVGGIIDPPVFTGRVISAGRPIAAQVGFEAPSGATSLTRFARSDAERGFTVLLPKAGMYGVSVTSLDDPSNQIDVGALALDDPARPVTITLPSSAMRVSVRQRGAPAGNISVSAVSYRESGHGTVHESRREGATHTDGQWRLESVMPGRWLVRALDPATGRRAEVAVDVQRGDSAHAELDLQDSSSLAGVVRFANGAASAEATVTCLYAGPAGLPRFTQTRTDVEGRFEISLPTPPPIRLQCAAATPSGQIAPFTTAPTANATVVVPATSGSLAIIDWRTAPDRDAFWLVSSDGRMFNLAWGGSGIARISAGAWRLLRASRPNDLLRLASGAPDALQTVTELRVQPGEVKTIRLHATDESEENKGGFE